MALDLATRLKLKDLPFGILIEFSHRVPAVVVFRGKAPLNLREECDMRNRY
jgi:hypothetical protein